LPVLDHHESEDSIENTRMLMRTRIPTEVNVRQGSTPISLSILIKYILTCTIEFKHLCKSTNGEMEAASMGHNRVLSRGIAFCLCALAPVFFSIVLAQQAPKQKQMPAGFARPPALVSPEIHADNRVTFRLSAPKASEVTLSGEWMEGFGASEKMDRNDEGVWSITVGPLTPEFYGYSFDVDGVKVLDPGNAVHKRDGQRVDCILLVPGKESTLYEVKDIPHGTLAKVWYESPTLDLTRRMYVYTPPGYESGSGKYPVFYLLHGGGGDEDAWSTLGRTSQILDNLISQGKALPMIVVMPNGNAYQAGTPGEIPAPAGQSGMSRDDRAKFSGMFEKSLVADIVPFIEKNYRVHAGKDYRAIAGLSMGGGHTFRITLDNPEMFGYIGIFSAGARDVDEKVEQQLETLKAGNRLYWVACGVDDRLTYTSSQALVASLDKLRFNHTFRESSGGHTWANWRIYLSEIAPLLFK
jgi:enterochelin esterase-like enzyme